MCDAVAATGREINEPTHQDAVKLGYISTLKHLHSRGRLRYKVNLCEAAASSGQFEVLKVLRAKGCPWDWRTCAYAAEFGHLEVLQWARENDCPWDEKTCTYAVVGGNPEVLLWLRANGCPWNTQARQMAAKLGYVEPEGPDESDAWDNELLGYLDWYHTK